MKKKDSRDVCYTPFHLSLSDNSNNQYCVLFENRVLVTSEIELLEAIKVDHVCAELKSGQRREDNFLAIDCLFADVDNDDSKDEESMKLWDDPSGHMTIERFREQFKDYEFVLYTSRNHNKEKETEKNGVKSLRPAREKFHVIFPLGKDIRISQEIKELLSVLCESFRREDGVPYFDKALKDPCRMFFSSGDSPLTLWNSGRSILEWIGEHMDWEKVEQQVEVEKDTNVDWFTKTVIPSIM